jgi:hypothetical protein
MKSSNTWRLFFSALALFAFIYFYESRDEKRAPSAGATPIFGNILTREITAVEYRNPASNQVIRAERTNDAWRLTTPLYPAQTTPIEVFLSQVAVLPKLDVINPSAVVGRLKEFGLEPPAGVISLNVGSNKHQLQIGGRDPISNQLYVQMAGSAEVILTDSAILKAIPASVDAWRSLMLTHLGGRPFDRLQIWIQQRLLEFERDQTNQLWRISKPTPARADSVRLDQLISRLTATQVKQFVTDLPVVDLERYGLQSPALELALLNETNRVTSFQFGSSPANDPGSIYVRRMMHTNIVTVSREIFDELNQPYKAFHDPRLISADTNQLTQIRINGTNGFTVAKVTNGVWQVTEPAPMAADPGLMRQFLGLLGEIKIVDFAKDVPSEADLKAAGLTPPRLTVSLFAAVTNSVGAVSNALISEVSFGSNKEVDTIFSKRNDEIPIYVSPFGEVLPLPNFGWQLRDRRIFNFASTNVTGVGVIVGSITNMGGRNAFGWTTNEILNAQIDESLYRLGNLHARRWVAKGTRNVSSFGISDDSVKFQMQVAQNGLTNSHTIWFGKRGIQNNIYAATVLPGDDEVTAFEFPGELYELLAQAGLAPAQ